MMNFDCFYNEMALIAQMLHDKNCIDNELTMNNPYADNTIAMAEVTTTNI
jgi:hypothetical protein